MRAIFGGLGGGGGGREFPVITETTHSHVFTKEINHASTFSQYVNGISIVNIVCECLLL